MTRRALASIALLLIIATGICLAFGRDKKISPSSAPEATGTSEQLVTPTPYPLPEGRYVVVNTKSMTVDLMDGTNTLREFPIVTIGKPDSYYETLGGSYENDYKIRNHFSSIGHVYMPWSVHIFGNFFIHGIPYYPDGTRVGTTYSGGCVRLNDADAEALYDFVHTGTPIIVTEDNAYDFAPTQAASPSLFSLDMTRFMAGVVSLEVLTQDSPIVGPDGKTSTRRALLPFLLAGDDRVTHIYAKDRGEQIFLDYMNEKAKSLGLTNTTFSSLDGEASTTPEDFSRFISYIKEYKTYLYSIALTQLPAFR